MVKKILDYASQSKMSLDVYDIHFLQVVTVSLSEKINLLVRAPLKCQMSFFAISAGCLF